MSKQGVFTHAYSGKTCPSCKKPIYPGQIIGKSLIAPKSERKWLCHPCAVAKVGV